MGNVDPTVAVEAPPGPRPILVRDDLEEGLPRLGVTEPGSTSPPLFLTDPDCKDMESTAGRGKKTCGSHFTECRHAIIGEHKYWYLPKDHERAP